MGCGSSVDHDDLNYHGVAAPYTSLEGSSVPSQISNNSLDSDENVESPYELSRMKRKRRAKAREKHRKRIEDRLRGIDEFHVKFIAEHHSIGRAANSHNNAFVP